jgi:hypothetical protein
VTWVRRAAAGQPRHACTPPTREAVYTLPALETSPSGQPWPEMSHTETVPDGEPGDLWRCDGCGRLWQCDWCDQYGDGGPPHRGMHAMGVVWRPATWWQRLRHARRT